MKNRFRVGAALWCAALFVAPGLADAKYETHAELSTRVNALAASYSHVSVESIGTSRECRAILLLLLARGC